MGIHGLFGFCYKGKYYIVYNAYDSHPSRLGNDLLMEIKKAIDAGILDDWKKKIRRIIVVVPGDAPTPEQIRDLEPYKNLEVSRRKNSDWYCLLHKCQGSFERVLNSGYIENSNGYLNVNTRPTVNLFHEYLYILDFDRETFGCWSNVGQEAIYPLSRLPEDVTAFLDEDN